MNHRSFGPALLAVLVCAATLPALAQTRGATALVRVAVVGGAIEVSTDKVVLASGAGTITWQMSTPGWRFGNGSIDFGDAAGGFSCRVFEGGVAISCNRNASAPSGEIPYRIRVSNGGALVLPPQPYVFISLD